jgi:hypothetical protein
MLMTQDGIRYLAEDSMLRQLVECFTELDQVGTEWLLKGRDHAG